MTGTDIRSMDTANTTILHGVASVRDWASCQVQPLLQEITTVYSQRLKAHLDDDFFSDEDIIDLLEGRVETTTNGDDEDDAKVAAMCAEYRMKKESALEESVLVLGANQAELESLQQVLQSLQEPLLQGARRFLVSSPAEALEAVRRAHTPSQRYLYVIMLINTDSSIAARLAEVVRTSAHVRLLLVVRGQAGDLDKVILFRADTSSTEESGDADWESAVNAERMASQLSSLGRELSLRADAFEKNVEGKAAALFRTPLSFVDKFRWLFNLQHQ